MNNSTLSKKNQEVIQSSLYVAFGVTALLLNVVAMLVISTDRKIFVKQALFFGLCLGDFFNGLGVANLGSWRLSYGLSGVLDKRVTPFYCFGTISGLYLFGAHLHLVMMLAIGAERAVAILFFNWYRVKWTSKLSWSLAGSVYAYSLFVVFCVFLALLLDPSPNTVSNSCPRLSIAGPYFAIYLNYTLPLLCGCTAVFCTLYALFIMKFKKNHLQANQAAYYKKQWHITIVMSIVAFVDFWFIIVANVLLCLKQLNLINDPSFTGYVDLVTFLFCAKSITSFFIYVMFSRDFRTKLFNFKKNTVVPSSTAAATVTTIKVRQASTTAQGAESVYK